MKQRISEHRQIQSSKQDKKCIVLEAIHFFISVIPVIVLEKLCEGEYRFVCLFEAYTNLLAGFEDKYRKLVGCAEAIVIDKTVQHSVCQYQRRAAFIIESLFRARRKQMNAQDKRKLCFVDLAVGCGFGKQEALKDWQKSKLERVKDYILKQIEGK